VDFRDRMMMHASSEFARSATKSVAPNASPFSHVKSREPLYPGEGHYTESFRAIRENSTTCGKYRARGRCERIWRNIARSMARRCFVDTRALAVGLLDIVANQKKHVQTLARGSDQKRIEIAA